MSTLGNKKTKAFSHRATKLIPFGLWHAAIGTYTYIRQQRSKATMTRVESRPHGSVLLSDYRILEYIIKSRNQQDLIISSVGHLLSMIQSLGAQKTCFFLLSLERHNIGDKNYKRKNMYISAHSYIYKSCRENTLMSCITTLDRRGYLVIYTFLTKSSIITTLQRGYLAIYLLTK